jgi:hypothetical protein
VSLAINAPGSGNWPVYIADQQGFFRAQGLNVSIVTSGSNVNTINMLATGATNAFQAAAEMVRRRCFETLGSYFAAGIIDRNLRDELARDPWAYGIAPSRPALDTNSSHRAHSDSDPGLL